MVGAFLVFAPHTHRVRVRVMDRVRIRVSDSVYAVWCKNRGDPGLG